MDKLTKVARSALISKIKPEDTGPERVVEAILRRMRVHFERHAADLPGRPDFVLRRRRLAVFVDGCFWHQHDGCAKARMPETNRRFWAEKFAANKARDVRVRRKLRRMGWRAATVRECGLGLAERKLRRILEYS